MLPSAPRIAWLLGWAIPQDWFAALAANLLPRATHTFIPATPHAFAALESHAPYDLLVGYSLGSHLLLREAPRASALAPRVELLAPIFTFCREANVGGRIPRANLRALTKLLARDPALALDAFYATAHLRGQVWDPAQLPADALLWGLQQLDASSIPPSLPPGWSARIGDADPLLDAAQLKQLIPALRVIPGASHHPRELLADLT